MLLVPWVMMLLSGTVTSLQPLPLWATTRIRPHQTLLATTSTSVQHHDRCRTATGCYSSVGGPSLRTGTLAPRMCLQTEIVAAVAITAINPACMALDGLAALLKIAWRLALATVLGIALKPTIMDVLKTPFIAKYTRQVKRSHLKFILALAFYPTAMSFARRSIGFVGRAIFGADAKLRPQRSSRRRSKQKKLFEKAEGGLDGGGGDGVNGGDGSGDGKGGGGGGDRGGDSGGGDGSGDGGGSEGGGDRGGISAPEDRTRDDRPTVRVLIKDENGQTMNFDLVVDGTVAEAMTAIENKLRVSPSRRGRRMLVIRGKQPRDEETLAQCRVRNGDTLFLFKRADASGS